VRIGAQAVFSDRPEVVGEGGFGKVSRARHRRTGEVVAIKTISKSKLGDEEALQLEVSDGDGQWWSSLSSPQFTGVFLSFSIVEP